MGIVDCFLKRMCSPIVIEKKLRDGPCFTDCIIAQPCDDGEGWGSWVATYKCMLMKTMDTPMKKLMVSSCPNSIADISPVRMVAMVEEYFFKIVSVQTQYTV